MIDIDFTLQLAGPKTLDFFPVFPKQAVRMSDQGIRMIVAVVDGDQNPVNIRAATTKMIKLMKPDGTTFDATGLLFSNGADGKTYFVSTISVPPFNQVGEWWIQVKLVIGGVAQSTQWANFAVEPNIDAN